MAGIYGLAVSSDGHVVATVGWDGTCRVWSVRMQKPLFVLPLQAQILKSPIYRPHIVNIY